MSYLEEQVSGRTAAIMIEAHEQADRLGISREGAHNGALDAFRHAYSSGRMTQDLGETLARKGGFKHEQSHPNDIREHVMDLYNNEYGRSIAATNPDASPEALADLIHEQGIKNGGLITDLSDPRIDEHMEKYKEQMDWHWLFTQQEDDTQRRVLNAEDKTRELFAAQGFNYDAQGGDRFTLAIAQLAAHPGVGQKAIDPIEHIGLQQETGQIIIGNRQEFGYQTASISTRDAFETDSRQAFKEIAMAADRPPLEQNTQLAQQLNSEPHKKGASIS